MNSELQRCIHCCGPTARRCTGCLGAPDYDDKSSTPTFYCSLECQKADWPRHRSECRKLQARKSLSRAALLLQAIIYKIRMHATTPHITSVHVDGTTIHLTGPMPDLLYAQKMKPFPVDLFQDQAVLEPTLVYSTCMEAMVYLSKFTMELLGDICSELTEINVSMINHRLRIGFRYTGGGPDIVTPQSMYHNVYKAVLKQGEVWAIDPTGAQFGYYEPLCPWSSFQKRISTVNRVVELGYIRHKVFYNPANYFLKPMITKRAEQEELVKTLEDWLLVWIKLHSGKFSAILQESEATFESTKCEFLEQLSAQIKNSVARMYIPVEIAKRTKRVEARISQNQVDPTSRNEFEGLLRFVVSAMGNSFS